MCAEQAMSTCHGRFPFCQGRSWGMGRALPVPRSGPGGCPRAECVHEPDSQRWWGRCMTWCLDPWCLCSPPVALPCHTSNRGRRCTGSAGSLRPVRWAWSLVVRQKQSPQCGKALERWNRPCVCNNPPRPARGTPVARSDSGGPRWLATFAFFGCHQALAVGPAARHGVDGPPQL